MRPDRAFFITGTDTGIGKTLVSTALLHAWRARGLRAAGMKPVASGCEATQDGYRNADALALQAASDPRPPYAQVNPYALPLPLAPELAAREADIEIEMETLCAAYAGLRSCADIVVVEGVGGWAAPLSATLDQADLVRILDLPVLLVVGMRLGCISHARLSAAAIAAAGAHLVGWIANHIDPQMEYGDEVFASVQERLQVRCWGRIAFDPMADARQVAGVLTLPAD